VNINTADEVQLESLPGIGPSLAANIVEYRQEHGWFQELDELLDVSGIGPAKLDQIDDLITFH
jgi:competence protein ComEA